MHTGSEANLRGDQGGPLDKPREGHGRDPKGNNGKNQQSGAQRQPEHVGAHAAGIKLEERGRHVCVVYCIPTGFQTDSNRIIMYCMVITVSIIVLFCRARTANRRRKSRRRSSPRIRIRIRTRTRIRIHMDMHMRISGEPHAVLAVVLQV